MKLNKRNQAFTLIELVMVIVIIGVLSAIIVPNFIDYVGRSEAATTKANLTLMRTAIQHFRSDNGGTYPANDLTNLVPTYLPSLPPEGVNNAADVATTFDGLGGWHWNTTSHVLLPNLAGADAYSTNFADY